MTISKYIVVPILTLVLLLVDWYVWQAVRIVFQDSSTQAQTAARYIFWGITMSTLIGLWSYNFIDPEVLGVRIRTVILASLFITYCSKLFSIVFLVIDDVSRLFVWSRNKLITEKDITETVKDAVNTITRSEFLMKTALFAAAIPAGALAWGVLSGAHDYRVRRIRLKINNLPKSFQGMTIAQISDIHTGSFFNKAAVVGGVEMLMKEKPEMVFFTGDLVNDRASEVKDYINIFDKIKAPLGVYSTLGNHDYGVYKRFSNPQQSIDNMNDIKKAHKELGYDLLCDENRIITLGGDKLAIIGVENISANESMFANTGSLKKAIENTDDAAVKFLLSHDPSHWDKEVNSEFKDIDVTFSGHTHGSQFGIAIGDQTYSPSQLSYKQWAGLYQKEDQQLYVNRGFGYLGYPGRVGMPPEITIFELASA
ncbi:metallophosphoesterase [Flavobacterium sp.]|uniref:metallophosphoesterase n=1 Tax=Flavobacterium sp. TaxID=239 RepID=UPI003D0AB4FE